MSQVILLMRDRASTRPLRFLWGLSISIVGLSVVLQSVGSGLLAAWLQLESSAAQALQAALFAGGYWTWCFGCPGIKASRQLPGNV